MSRIRALIVDDEPLARECIRVLAAEDSDLEIAGECENGEQEVAAILRDRPDVVFLDVQMPGIDGFEVLRLVGEQRLPVVVFVTAYDEYALKAFEVHALDYLLKPFDRTRFLRSLVRAKEALRRHRSAEIPVEIEAKLRALLREREQPEYLERLLIRAGGSIRFLKVEEIDWIEAEGNYLRLHAGAESHLIRETMNSIEARIDPRRFVRIHRSTIVNVDRIKEMRPWFKGDYVIVLRGGNELSLSRSYKNRLRRLVTDSGF